MHTWLIFVWLQGVLIALIIVSHLARSYLSHGPAELDVSIVANIRVANMDY
jgi:hypothetical protein